MRIYERKNRKPAGNRFEGYEGWDQKAIILDYLAGHDSLTTFEAFTELGITKLGTRISELIRQGWDFEKIQRSAVSRYGKKVRFTEYRLLGPSTWDEWDAFDAENRKKEAKKTKTGKKGTGKTDGEKKKEAEKQKKDAEKGGNVRSGRTSSGKISGNGKTGRSGAGKKVCEKKNDGKTAETVKKTSRCRGENEKAKKTALKSTREAKGG